MSVEYVVLSIAITLVSAALGFTLNGRARRTPESQPEA